MPSYRDGRGCKIFLGLAIEFGLRLHFLPILIAEKDLLSEPIATFLDSAMLHGTFVQDLPG